MPASDGSASDGSASDGSASDKPARAESNGAPPSVVGLLDPHREVVKFAGRDRELAELIAWCADGQDAPLRIVIGPSGVGKTRLAVELARQMRARGWRTWWADADGRGHPGRHAAIAMSHRKTLLIVDRADERQDLDELLVRLTTQQPFARFLLLAGAAGGWCDQLELYGQAHYALISAARSVLMALAPAVRAGLADSEVAEAAAACFAAELGRSAPATLVLRRTGGSAHRILDLHIAALLAVLDEADDQATRSVDPRSAAGELLGYEEGRWAATEPGTELAELNFGELSARQRVVAEYLLTPVSAQSSGGVRGLPPRVSDWLAATELAASPEFAKRCFTGIAASRAAAAACVLARAGAEDTLPMPSLDAAVGLLAGEIEDLVAPLPTLVGVLNVLPWSAPAWNEAAAVLCGRIVSMLGPAGDPAMRAYWLASLGARDWRAGRHAEAVRSTRLAVALRRELTEDDPDRHLASLALSLGNLGHQLAGLGQLPEGISAMEEAAMMYRATAVVSPSRHLPSLAATLTRLGRCYARAGRNQDAQRASDEAALLRRELAGDHAQASAGQSPAP
ncbi:MAG TPA: hypothetical protein VFQ44_25610 [Streptosporangiaceae bacterium]|nr:hypothetical protein [Streptosporangiaceae bacterium]